MAITFNLISATNRVPDFQVEFDPSGSSGPPTRLHKALIIGQRLSAGTVAAEIVKGITSDSQADEFFGQGSQIAAMIKAFRAINKATALYAVALDDDGAGVQASGDVTFAGTATADGIAEIWIHQTLVKVAIPSGTAHTAIPALFVTESAEHPDLQATLTDGGAGELTITAKNDGEEGNAIDIRMNYYDTEALPAGITAVVTAMSGGLSNPDVADALAAIGDSERYDTIVMPWNDASNMTAMETELEARWGPDRQNDGVCFVGIVDTHGNTQTFGDSRNSWMLCALGFGPILMTPWEGAARVAAIDAAMTHPARPRQRRQITGMLPPASGQEFDASERNLLLYDGISTVKPAAGGRMQIERLITMHQVNSAGFATVAYLNLTKVRTLSQLRYEYNAFFASKYPDYMLAPDGTEVDPGVAVVTPGTIAVEATGLYKNWERRGLVINAAAFEEALITEINDSDSDRLDQLLKVDVMGGLRFMAGKMVHG